MTEIVELEGRGHSLTIDSGWRDVADKALALVKRFAQPGSGHPRSRVLLPSAGLPL